MSKKKVAILFFGLTRSLRTIHNNLKENLFDELSKNNYEYDTFVHTYILDNPYKNPWSGENIDNYDNTSYQILNPKEYLLENQNVVERHLQIPKYYSKLGNWKGCANTPEMKGYLVRNMVLALHSKKRVVNLFSKYQSEYDYVIITRPDQLLHTKFNVESFNLLNNNNIIIPHEHSYHGKNDRFCIAKPINAIKYGLAFNHLYLYSTKKSIVSEIYMQDYLKALNLNIIFSPLKTELCRC